MTFGRKIAWLTVACTAVLLIGVTTYSIWIQHSLPGDFKSGKQDISYIFNGESGTEIVRHPDKVEAYRIDEFHSSPTKNRIENYQVLSGPVRVPSALASELATAILSSESYIWEDLALSCTPRYGVCLSYFRGNNRVDIFICFECTVLLVSRDGNISGGKGFDPMQPTLVRAVKTLFPSDQVIQAIEEKQRRS
jgi:hypothetical protein